MNKDSCTREMLEEEAAACFDGSLVRLQEFIRKQLNPPNSYGYALRHLRQDIELLTKMIAEKYG